VVHNNYTAVSLLPIVHLTHVKIFLYNVLKVNTSEVGFIQVFRGLDGLFTE